MNLFFPVSLLILAMVFASKVFPPVVPFIAAVIVLGFVSNALAPKTKPVRVSRRRKN